MMSRVVEVDATAHRQPQRELRLSSVTLEVGQ